MEETRQLTFSDERKNIQEALENIHQNRHPISLLLDGVSDSRNVGAIFRLADAARLEKIYLYQCDFNPTSKKIHRTARSTLDYVPFEVLGSFEDVQHLAEQFPFVGLEITNTSQKYSNFQAPAHSILVIGSERQGISSAVLDLCPQQIHLPMYGIKTSMNVACATGIAVYHCLQFFEE